MVMLIAAMVVVLAVSGGMSDHQQPPAGVHPSGQPAQQLWLRQEGMYIGTGDEVITVRGLPGGGIGVDPGDLRAHPVCPVLRPGQCLGGSLHSGDLPIGLSKGDRLIACPAADLQGSSRLHGGRQLGHIGIGRNLPVTGNHHLWQGRTPR